MGLLSVEDWAEIRRLHKAERMPIKVIARVVGCSKNTVKRALAAEDPPRSVYPLEACRRVRHAAAGWPAVVILCWCS